MGIERELDRLGRRIEKDAKRYALPNKKTGRLDKSIKYLVSRDGEDSFELTLSQMDYGKYLNAKTHYLDKAIDRNLDNGIDSIVDVVVEEITYEILNIKF